MGRFATHLEAAIDGTRLDHRTLQTLHEGRPLWVRYDLDGIRGAVTRDEVERRPPDLWRYDECLPVEDPANRVSLGEGMSPLLSTPRLAAEFGLQDVWIKDESQLPGGSFKSRGMALAISRAKELGVKRVAVPTAGNAGGAMAAYAARAGLEAWVFLPADTPIVNQLELPLHGARAFLVDGLIDDCGKVVRAGAEAMGWFDVSTLKEPYRIEGKKTMGYELAEQFGWSLPDWIFYPTGGGTGLIGMWKAFAELEQLGWIEPGQRPRMVSCQSDGCAPIVRAFEAGERHAPRFENAATAASGLRVPQAVGDFMILDAVRESGGTAIAAPEAELIPWMRRASALEGIAVCPEAAACLDGLQQLVAAGQVRPEDRVLIFNTGAAQKYVETLRTELPRLPPLESVDWSALAAGSR
jgi:threonine synthase